MSKENAELQKGMVMKEDHFLELNKTIQDLQKQVAIQHNISKDLVVQLNPSNHTSATAMNNGTSPNTETPFAPTIEVTCSSNTTL